MGPYTSPVSHLGFTSHLWALMVNLPHNWKPRPYQWDAWSYLRSGGRRAVCCWPRRSGKDDMFLHATAVAAHERIGNYWYMLPKYAQARKSMWDAVNPATGLRRMDEAFPGEIRASTRDQEMMIRFRNGSTLQLVGSDNFDSLVGSPPVGLVFSEYALANPMAWAYLRPILLENKGWAGFNSTPRGRNHFKSLCDLAAVEDGWFFQSLTNDDTGVFSAAQMQSELAELQSEHGAVYGKAIWLQEYFVSFDAAIPGSIWGDCLDLAQAEGRIGDVPLEDGVAVHTAWDLGSTDDTVIWWFQIALGTIRVIDYHESNFKDIPFYGDLLREKAVQRGFVYGTHYLPHDAKAGFLAAGGKSIQQQMMDQNVGRIIITGRLDHVDGIQAGRATFPYCWFDAKRTERGVEHLRAYKREWDEKEHMFRSSPKHDASSHAASAFRTLAQSWRRPKGPRKPGDQGLLDHTGKGIVLPNSFGALKKRHLAKARELREIRL